MNIFHGLNEIIRSLQESSQFDERTKITEQDFSTLNFFSSFMDTVKDATDSYINEIDRMHSMLFEL